MELLTENDMSMYLIFCGWSYIDSNIENDYWRGRKVWKKDGVFGYKTTAQAYHIERYENAN